MATKSSSNEQAGGGGAVDFVCRDLGEFKRVLDRMRQMEDRIVLRMNSELPTGSFCKSFDKRKICEDFQKQLLKTRKRREELLERCQAENREMLRQYQNDPDRQRELKMAYANLRLLKEESSVEEIVRLQADKALTERCRKELLR